MDQYRSLAGLRLSTYEMNIFGEVRNILTKKSIKPIDVFKNGRFDSLRLKHDLSKSKIMVSIETIVGLLFWDIENPIGPYKDRILEVREFMLIPVNDKRFIYDDTKFKTKYLVTRFGDVWNTQIKRKLNKTDVNGYLQVSLYRIHQFVHRLIAKAFCPIPKHLREQGYTFVILQVNHKDGNKGNNHWTNLEWCTNKENCEHASTHNLLTSQTKIPEDKLHEVIDLLSQGKTNIEISKITGVNPNSISNIKRQTTLRYQQSIQDFLELF